MGTRILCSGADFTSGMQLTNYTVYDADAVKPAFAVSVSRKIVEGYTGPLLQISNGTDTADIGVDSDDKLDIAAVLAFANGGPTTVTRVYPQIGDLGLIPLLGEVYFTNNTGELFIRGGHPTMYFDGGMVDGEIYPTLPGQALQVVTFTDGVPGAVYGSLFSGQLQNTVIGACTFERMPSGYNSRQDITATFMSEPNGSNIDRHRIFMGLRKTLAAPIMEAFCLGVRRVNEDASREDIWNPASPSVGPQMRFPRGDFNWEAGTFRYRIDNGDSTQAMLSQGAPTPDPNKGQTRFGIIRGGTGRFMGTISEAMIYTSIQEALQTRVEKNMKKFFVDE